LRVEQDYAVILRQCEWQKTTLGSLHPVSRNFKPMTDWDNLEKAWAEIIQNNNEVLEQARQVFD
jgi:hypothetical protein